jgi:hypothetical protein
LLQEIQTLGLGIFVVAWGLEMTDAPLGQSLLDLWAAFGERLAADA